MYAGVPACLAWCSARAPWIVFGCFLPFDCKRVAVKGVLALSGFNARFNVHGIKCIESLKKSVVNNQRGLTCNIGYHVIVVRPGHEVHVGAASMHTRPKHAAGAASIHTRPRHATTAWPNKCLMNKC